MRSCAIHDLPEWRVTSWGDGLAYSIDHKPSGNGAWFESDDADYFRSEFDRLTTRAPVLSYADALTIIFQEHEARQC